MAARRWVLRFRLSDGAAGTKTRLEATTCFGTNASLCAHGGSAAAAGRRRHAFDHRRALGGPLGRHDDGRIPYFKIGVYNPSGDTAPVEVTFANLTHATGPPPPPSPPPALPSADGE